MVARYLKTWTGVTSGSMAGRNDGYPETKYVSYLSMSDLAASYGQHKDERYYKLDEIDKVNLEKEFKKHFQEKTKIARQAKKKYIEREIKKLQGELESLS